MKARTSSLNPYATSYIPLSRRGGATDESKSTATDSKTGNQAAWSGRYSESHDPSAAVPDSLKFKDHSGFGSSSHSAVLAGKQAQLDVDHDMNLAYLQMTFPGVSDESLSSVYTANGGDMEATVEMLNQLELHSGGFSDDLPDSLDIGDVSEEAGPSSAGGSQKLKKVVVGDGSWWNPPK